MDASYPSVECRPVVGFPGYLIGVDGSVWSQWWPTRTNGSSNKHHIDTSRPARRRATPPDSTSKGYPWLSLQKDGKQYLRRVHVLMLETFVGPRPEGLMGLHRDDNPNNMSLTNLYWGTQAQNMRDSEVNGNRLRGEKCASAKMTSVVALAIIRLEAEGKDFNDISRVVGFHPSSVRHVLKGRTWSHVTGRKHQCSPAATRS